MKTLTLLRRRCQSRQKKQSVQICGRNSIAAGVLKQKHLIEPTAFIEAVGPSDGTDIENTLQRSVRHQHAGCFQRWRKSVPGEKHPQAASGAQPKASAF